VTRATTAILLALLPILCNAADPPPAGRLCRIQVVEKDSGWPVPLVQLRTTNKLLFVTDNAGTIAIDEPDLLGREVFFHVAGHGYEVPQDMFKYRGVRLTPQPGKSLTVEVTRTIVARRLGRLTGAGLFAHSQKLGHELGWKESGVVGCDSVQMAAHRDRLFWLWGDTSLPHYPLGIFHASSATSALKPIDSFKPPLRVKFDYFRNKQGRPRGVAKMPGTGPTWLTGYVSLTDKSGTPRLVATYAKIKPPLEVYQQGLCVWNDKTENFEKLKVVWTKSDDAPKPPPLPTGHPLFWSDEDGKPWVLFGNPLPTLRCPATFEAWQDPTQWKLLEPQKSLVPAGDGKDVKPHSGSIAWNPYRKRWVTVFMQWFGKPSAFGELWYAEADSPTGPWGKCVKILSHDNYTFYNPRIHPELTSKDASFLVFEGTYTQTFANKPHPTPRYDYNQILYRLDLDDDRLEPAH
jgi:hypothetical protein